jgi:hypothetical protein
MVVQLANTQLFDQRLVVAFGLMGRQTHQYIVGMVQKQPVVLVR